MDRMLRLVVDDHSAWEGKRLPWYVGAAYRDVSRQCTVFYPVPVNWVVRWWMVMLRWWDIVRLESSPRWVRRSEISTLLDTVQESGRQVGYAQGYKQGWHDALERLLEHAEQGRGGCAK